MNMKVLNLGRRNLVKTKSRFLQDCDCKGSFIRAVNITVFVRHLSSHNVMCKQLYRAVLNTFLNGTKNGECDAPLRSLAMQYRFDNIELFHRK